MTSNRFISGKVLNILKLILGVGTIGFVFYKLFVAYHIQSFSKQFEREFEITDWLLMLGCVLLVSVNLLLEAGKWKVLLLNRETINLKQALISVMCGITLGMISPNQIGGFAGQILYLKVYSRIRGTLLSVIGHTAQLAMTLIFGLAGFAFFMRFKLWIGALAFVYVLIASCLLGLLIYWGFHQFHRISGWWKRYAWSRYLDVFSGYTSLQLNQIWFYSMIRYVVIIVQYLFMVKFYQVNVSLSVAVICISSTLFVQAFMPSFILIDIGLRGASALFLFGAYTGQTAEVLLMTYSIWVINLLIPGLFGLAYILRWRGAEQ